MKKALVSVFFVFWTAAFCFPAFARFVLLRAGIVQCEPFNLRGENRNPAPRPTLLADPERHVAPKDLGRGLEAWFNDSLPWRTELLRFHKKTILHRFKSPVGRDVPGRGDWIFRYGGDWPELDDYLGAKELTPEELADWIALFEGRREWGRAVGCAFLTVPATTMAQARWQELYPAVRRHRGRNVAAQVREALADSPARDDVIFADDAFDAAFAAGRETFYDFDHHPNAYGIWIFYDCVNRRLRELFPDRIGEGPAWFDDPPPDVLEGRAPGCWLERTGAGLRLDVSSPGETQDDAGVPTFNSRYPFSNVSTVRPGGGVSILMAHDSFFRFSLASWRRGRGSVRFPFASGVGRVKALIFGRFNPVNIDRVTAAEIPDVLIEQFPACRLDGSVVRFLDDSTRAAAVFGRSAEPEPGRAPRAGDRVVARAVFDGVSSDSGDASGASGDDAGAGCEAVLRFGGEIGRRTVSPGVRRVVFFDPVELAGTGDLGLSLEGGTSETAVLSWRFAPGGGSGNGPEKP